MNFISKHPIPIPHDPTIPQGPWGDILSGISRF